MASKSGHKTTDYNNRDFIDAFSSAEEKLCSALVLTFTAPDYSLHMFLVVLRGFLTSLHFLCKASKAATKETLGAKKVIWKTGYSKVIKIINFPSCFLSEIVSDKNIFLVSMGPLEHIYFEEFYTIFKLQVL